MYFTIEIHAKICKIGSMDGDELKRLVPKWAEKIGTCEARLKLQLAGLGFSTAEKLIKGEYESTPKWRTVGILKKVMADFMRVKAS